MKAENPNIMLELVRKLIWGALTHYEGSDYEWDGSNEDIDMDEDEQADFMG